MGVSEKLQNFHFGVEYPFNKGKNYNQWAILQTMHTFIFNICMASVSFGGIL